MVLDHKQKNAFVVLLILIIWNKQKLNNKKLYHKTYKYISTILLILTK